MNTTNENIKSKLVFDPLTARALLRRGMRAIDCKPLKNDRTKTIIVFEDTQEFRAALSEISKEWVSAEMNVHEIDDPRIARYLLKRGEHLVDYKAVRADGVTKMIFVFENTEEFQLALAQIIEEIEVKKIEWESKQLATDLD